MIRTSVLPYLKDKMLQKLQFFFEKGTNLIELD